MGILIIEIRWFHDHLMFQFVMESLYLKDSLFILNWAPGLITLTHQPKLEKKIISKILPESEVVLILPSWM